MSLEAQGAQVLALFGGYYGTSSGWSFLENVYRWGWVREIPASPTSSCLYLVFAVEGVHFLPQRAAAIPSPAVVDSPSGTGPQINSSSFKMLWVMVFYHSERQVMNSWTSVGCLEITSCELSDFVLLFLFCFCVSYQCGTGFSIWRRAVPLKFWQKFHSTGKSLYVAQHLGNLSFSSSQIWLPPHVCHLSCFNQHFVL